MKKSRKSFKKAKHLPDSEIDFSDIPEMGEEFWSSATVVIPKSKKAISFRMDEGLIDWYKSAAKGGSYQSLMHAVLQAYADAMVVEK